MGRLSAAIKRKKERAGRPSRYNGDTPTNAGSCQRLIWYKVHHLDDMISGGSVDLLRMEEGNYQEDIMAHMITDNIPGAMITERNTKTLEGKLGVHPIRGRPDGLLYLDGSVFVLEFKHMNMQNFSRFKSLGLKRSHPGYYDQVQMTMQIARQTWPKVGITRAFLMAKLRDDQIDIWDEELVIDSERLKELEQVFDDRLKILGNAEEPPERPYEMDKPPCTYCEARELCWRGEYEDDLAIPVEITSQDQAIGLKYLENRKDRKEMQDDRNMMREYFAKKLRSMKQNEIFIPIDQQEDSGPRYAVRVRRSVYPKPYFSKNAALEENPTLIQKHTVTNHMESINIDLVTL